jgi:hypothetical protein
MAAPMIDLVAEICGRRANALRAHFQTIPMMRFDVKCITTRQTNLEGSPSG